MLTQQSFVQEDKAYEAVPHEDFLCFGMSWAASKAVINGVGLLKS